MKPERDGSETVLTLTNERPGLTLLRDNHVRANQGESSMFVATVRPRYWLISLAVSVGIFLLLYFTIIKPDNNAANNAVRQGEQQAQQIVNQASKSGAIPAGVTSLVSCVAAAGTNTSELQACQAKFKP
jgi:hypothetical protein